MKHTHSALLLVCLAVFLLTGCGSDKAGSSENPYVCTKQTASAGNYVTYDYDANGNCTKESRYSASGNLTGWTETTYSEDNQPTEILTYNESGDVQTRVQNKYKNGNLAVTVSLDGSNGKDYEEAFSYDKNGHLTKRVHTENHGSASNNYWCEITTDRPNLFSTAGRKIIQLRIPSPSNLCTMKRGISSNPAPTPTTCWTAGMKWTTMQTVGWSIPARMTHREIYRSSTPIPTTSTAI